ncbi:MAG: hypothetical protein OXT70_01325 [Chloroflexota bacterium]|nr:hypothetical protein [Chloroflexota bacterium]
MSATYVVADLPPISQVETELGVDYDADPVFDGDGEPVYPPDGTVSITVYGQTNSSLGINLSLDLAEELWGKLGKTIQAVKHERQPAP